MGTNLTIWELNGNLKKVDADLKIYKIQLALSTVVSNRTITTRICHNGHIYLQDISNNGAQLVATSKSNAPS